jgi:hypothetical protein
MQSKNKNQISIACAHACARVPFSDICFGMIEPRWSHDFSVIPAPLRFLPNRIHHGAVLLHNTPPPVIFLLYFTHHGAKLLRCLLPPLTYLLHCTDHGCMISPRLPPLKFIFPCCTHHGTMLPPVFTLL